MRADWTRHWDRLCLTALTLGTAALAVVVVFVFEAISVVVTGTEVPAGGVMVITAVSAIVSAAFYFVLAAFVGLVVFFAVGETSIQLLVKCWASAFVYFLLLAEIAVIVFILILNLGIIATTEFGQDDSGSDAAPPETSKGVAFLCAEPARSLLDRQLVV